MQLVFVETMLGLIYQTTFTEFIRYWLASNAKVSISYLKEVFFLYVKMSFLTNVLESVCVCRMITKFNTLEKLHPEDTFSYL